MQVAIAEWTRQCPFRASDGFPTVSKLWQMNLVVVGVFN